MQPPQSVGEHPRRCVIQPVHVVDGDHEWPRPTDGTQNVKSGETNPTQVRWSVLRLGEHERDLERPTTRPWHRANHVGHRVPNQVAERREGQRRLGLHSAAGQDRSDPAAGDLHGLLPDDRLADACVAQEKQASRALRNTIEKGPHQRELPLTTEQITGHEGLPSSSVEQRR